MNAPLDPGRRTLLKAGGLVVNVLIVAYLVRVLRRRED